MFERCEPSRARRRLHGSAGVLALAVLAPSTALADWLSELRLGSELAGRSSLNWLLEKRSLPITQRVSLDYLRQSAGDRYGVDYRAQFNISSSFYHFAQLSAAANRAAGFESRQTALIATANSPYRGPAGGLALEVGAGFAQLEFSNSLSADRDDGAQPVLMFGGQASRSLGDRFDVQLGLVAIGGGNGNDLTTTLTGRLRLNANTSMQLGYRLHQIDWRTSPSIRDESLILSIGYQIDWMPARKRWPDT